MMGKKIIMVVCGSGIATSTAAAQEIKEKLAQRGVFVETKQTNVFALSTIDLKDVSLIASTCRLENNYGIPVINVVPLLTGINEDKVIEEIIKKLS
jgi:PTS system galactitol-specific IIB component